MHKNPQVREIADIYLSGHSRIELVEPLKWLISIIAHQSYIID